MIEYAYLVIFIRLIIVILGFLLTWKTISISRKSKENNFAYRSLSLGFLIFTMSQVIEGILFEFTNTNTQYIHIVEGILSSISFVLIILAIIQFRLEIDFESH